MYKGMMWTLMHSATFQSFPRPPTTSPNQRRLANQPPPAQYLECPTNIESSPAPHSINVGNQIDSFALYGSGLLYTIIKHYTI